MMEFDQQPNELPRRPIWTRLRWLVLACAIAELIVVVLAVGVEADSLVAVLRRNGVAVELRSPVAVELRNPLPPGEEYAEVNQVSDYPADWIAAVCTPPVFPLRASASRLPNSTDSAVCQARIQPPGEVPNLTIAHFPTELPMQVDLANAGYNWYAFAFDHGEMLAFATWSETTVSDPVTNLGESPVLMPLRRFGFTIYRSPGP